MARNYAALPHDYLEEMELLTDAEFGRLCRALLRYSSTGEMEELSGNERVLFPRVKMQEDRFQASYDELAGKRSNAGKQGAAKRWNNEDRADNAEDNIDTVANSKNSNAMHANGKNGKAMAANGKNGNTETKTKTETSNSPPYPPTWGERLHKALDEWLAYKREKRQPYKPQGLKSLITQVDGYLSKYGEKAVVGVITRSMAANYQGIVWDWLPKTSGNRQAQSAPKQEKEFQSEDLLWMQKYMENHSDGEEK